MSLRLGCSPRTPHVLGLCITASVVLFGKGESAAEPLIDHLGPRALAMGESGRADAKGPASFALNPAGLALDHKLLFSANYGYRKEDKATILSASACDSTVPIAGCFYYKYLSSESGVPGLDSKRRLHEFGTSLSRILSPQLILGTTARYFDFNSNITGEKDESGYATDIGLLFLPTSSFRAALVGYNVVASDSVAFPRGVGSGLTFAPGGPLSVSVDGLWNLELPDDTTIGRYSGGAEFVFSGDSPSVGYPVRFGGVYDMGSENGYLSYGLGFFSGKVGLNVGGRKQISGDGDEFILQAGLQLIGATPSPGR